MTTPADVLGASLVGNTIVGAFLVQRLLGVGSFGAVYDGIDIRTTAAVAMKVELQAAEHPQLRIEAEVLLELQDTCPGIPRMLWYGHHDLYNVLVMQRLGQSLETLRRKYPDGRMSAAAVVAIVTQALDILQGLHAAGFVHRDLKPDNLMLGRGPTKELLYLIDFGLCKRVVNPATGTHVARITGKPVIGTPRFASLACHAGIQSSRADDVEMLGYVAVYLARGTLPWQGMGASDPTYAAIAKAKQDLPLTDLCAGLPSAFEDTIAYARGLPFGAMPDFEYLRGAWRDAACLCTRPAAVLPAPTITEAQVTSAGFPT